MSEYPPLHCRAGRHGRVLAADTGSVLQRLELDVCLSAGAATGLQSGPSTQHPAWPSDCDLAVCREPADTLMQPRTLRCQSVIPPSPRLCIADPRLQVTIHTRPHIVDWRQHKVRCGPHWLLQSLMTLSGPGRGLHLRGVIITQNCVCMSAAVCTVCSIIMSVASVSPSGQCRSVVTCCDPERRGVCCLQCGNRGTQTITAQTVTKVRRNILILRKHQRQSQLWWASVRSRN